jgi:hypothetical protein
VVKSVKQWLSNTSMFPKYKGRAPSPTCEKALDYVEKQQQKQHLLQGILTNLQVTPRTHIGVWADCEMSNKLYSNVWFLWNANKSNSSRTNRIGLLDWLPENIKYTCNLHDRLEPLAQKNCLKVTMVTC